MRRERVVDGALAIALVPLALLVAFPFRADALAKSPLSRLGWDAALHATEGLDLFDDLRLLRPFDACALLASRHWWGPLWAVASAPFQAVFGPSVAAASLPSLASFALVPSAAFLLIRRLVPGGLLASCATGLLVMGLFLRSPMLLESSAWPMLESLGGFLALLAWLFFARRQERAGRSIAFLSGSALFLLKYHFGFFVLATFAAVVLVEEPAESRREVGRAVGGLFARKAGPAILAIAASLAALRPALEAARESALARLVPSAPNVLWGTLVLFVFLGSARRRIFEVAWRGASPTLRDFLLFGLVPPASWCLDPANVRGWWRQIFQPTDVPAWDPFGKIAAFLGFLRDDYTLGAAPAGLVLVGLALALVLPDDRTRRALAAFVLWPVLLMSLNTYPVEARFLACLAPCVFVVAVAGLAAGAERALGRERQGAALVVVATLFVACLDGARWSDERRARAPFRYSYGAVEAAAVEAAVASATPEGPVRITMSERPPVWPTVRLALRLSRRDVAPRLVEVAAR